MAAESASKSETRQLSAHYSSPSPLENPRILESQFSKLINHQRFKGVSTGVMLYEVSPNFKRVFRKNAFEAMIPASILKLLISTVALDKLGQDYQFETYLFTDGKQINDTLHGNLYLVGHGAPDIALHELQKLVNELLKKGISKITGNLYADASFFSKQAPGHPRKARFYNAPSSALTFNGNSVEFLLLNDVVPTLIPSPNIGYIRYQYDQLKLNISKNIPLVPTIEWVAYPWGDQYIISGQASALDFQNHYLRALVSRPARFTASALMDLLYRANIQISGEVSEKKRPQMATLLAQIKSDPLLSFIKRLNVESHNVIAANLTHFIGTQADTYVNGADTLMLGIQAVSQYCKHRIGIDPLHFILEDTTGLSSENRFKPNDFMKFLRFIQRHEALKQLLILSTPNSNEWIQSGLPLPSHLTLYYKTGTLAVAGVNTMIGFIHDISTQKQYAFVIMANRYQKGPLAFKGTYTYPILNWMFTLI
jgi:D-alanyl-D-alanine carboxypeptidase/D-alanyl-D-alanine-endopeptidase (penicillin-binding protein 4)